jgi:hypothetical protein
MPKMYSKCTQNVLKVYSKFNKLKIQFNKKLENRGEKLCQIG